MILEDVDSSPSSPPGASSAAVSARVACARPLPWRGWSNEDVVETQLVNWRFQQKEPHFGKTSQYHFTGWWFRKI